MTRLVLALVTAGLVGTGCLGGGDNCSRSTFLVAWEFQRFDGSPPAGCVAAGVEWVDIYMDGQLVGNGFPCGDQQAVITAVQAGSYDMVVEGIDTAGRIAYRERFTMDSSGCGNRSVLARPAEGIVNLDYAATCSSSPCYLWLSVHDEIANTTAAEISTGSPFNVQVSFPYPDDVVFRLAAGSYTLDWMQLVSAAFTSEAITCAAIPFDIAAVSQTDVPVPLSCQ